MEDVLRIKNLKVSFETYEETVAAVRGVSFCVKQGEILALVGESGCGKSVTAQSVLKLNDAANVHTSAETLLLNGHHILDMSEKEMAGIRGKSASMIFQNPTSCLNPTMKVGKQVTESLLRRKTMTAKECEVEAVRLLEQVQIKDAAVRAKQYPYQFSGGMRQRAMIAMALACRPKLIIADEPTTALDVTVQLQILRLLHKIRKESQTAVLFITHDLSVVANIADRAAVMYAGQIVEECDTARLFAAPLHPYTQGLLESIPVPGTSKELASISGFPPDLRIPIKGCAFADRCKYCMDICKRHPPVYQERQQNHYAACWKLQEEGQRGEEKCNH